MTPISTMPATHQVVAVAGVARVDDEEAEAGVDGDHLGRHHHQPGDAEREPQPDDELRQHRREDHAHAAARATTSPKLRPALQVHRRDRRAPRSSR